MARPLREQLRERVNNHHERAAKMASQETKASDRVYRGAAPPGGECDVATDTLDPGPTKGYASGMDSPLPGVAIMPRVGELEDARRLHDQRMTMIEEGVVHQDARHCETESQLATAVARLAKLVGVNPSDLGL